MTKTQWLNGLIKLDQMTQSHHKEYHLDALSMRVNVDRDNKRNTRRKVIERYAKLLHKNSPYTVDEMYDLIRDLKHVYVAVSIRAGEFGTGKYVKELGVKLI